MSRLFSSSDVEVVGEWQTHERLWPFSEIFYSTFKIWLSSDIWMDLQHFRKNTRNSYVWFTKIPVMFAQWKIIFILICLPLITFVFVVVILLQCAPHISGSLRVAALQNSPINTWPTLTRWILRHRCSNTCVSLCTSLSSIVHCCLSGSKLLTISVYKPARAGGWYPTDARFSVGSDSAVPELIGPALYYRQSESYSSSSSSTITTSWKREKTRMLQTDNTGLITV